MKNRCSVHRIYSMYPSWAVQFYQIEIHVPKTYVSIIYIDTI